jgi:hypothetical protein
MEEQANIKILIINQNMLLSFRYKIPGYILIITGLILTTLYFTIDFRFEFPVFALFSSYMETRFLTFFRTNFADELIMLTLISGFSLVAFSREKNEQHFFSSIRYKAMSKTAVLNTSFLVLSILFIYGSGFAGIVLINIFSPFIIYLVLFNFMKIKETKKRIGL